MANFTHRIRRRRHRRIRSKNFPSHPTDAENEEHYDYGAGVDGVDDDIPVIINDDEDYSFENNEVVISSDVDDEDELLPEVLRKKKK